MFLTEKSFDATISRNARGNFNRPPAGEIGPKASVSRTAVMENKTMAKVISLVEMCDVKLNLVQIMAYRITEECLSLFSTNGTMVKVQKSKLAEKLNLIPFQTLDSYIALIEMGFIWRLATPSPEDREKDDETHFTWLDYANKLFSLVMARHPKASEIIFVNDPYDSEISIKDSEHERRTGGAAYTGGA